MSHSINRPRITCANGVSLSVQASDFHYSSPRINGFELRSYSTVEVGFIEKDGHKFPAPPSWIGHAEENGRASDVFAYVPFSFVKRFIAANGGSADIDLG